MTENYLSLTWKIGFSRMCVGVYVYICIWNAYNIPRLSYVDIYIFIYVYMYMYAYPITYAWKVYTFN